MITRTVDMTHFFVILSLFFLFNNNYIIIYLHCGVGPMGGTCLLPKLADTAFWLYMAEQLYYFEVIFCASALRREQMRPRVLRDDPYYYFLFFLTGGLHDSDQH